MTTQAPTRPWLTEGSEIEGLKTTHEALADANLDFTVEKVQTIARVPNGTEDMEGEQVPVFKEVEAPFFYTVRMDTKQVLGCVGKSYTVVQTHEAVKFFDEALGENAYCIDSVGQINNGSRLWLAAKVPESVVIAKDDIVDRYILLTVGHDGHWGVNALFTGIRPLCANTVTAAMRGAKAEGRQIIKVKHTTNAQKNLKNALQLVAQEKKFWGRLAPAFQKMATLHITADVVDEYLESVFPSTKKDDNGDLVPAKQTKDRRDFVKWALDYSPGAAEAGHTVWGLYNAYTWWVDHSEKAVKDKAYVGMPTDGTRKVKGSAWENTTFASGAKLRQKALDVALSMV